MSLEVFVFVGGLIVQVFIVVRCRFDHEVFDRSCAGNVVICSMLQGEGEGPLVPIAPAQAVDFVARKVECCAQVSHIELMVWVAATGVQAVHSKLCSDCRVVQGIAGAGLAVAFFEAPQVFRLNQAVGTRNYLFEPLFLCS